MKRIILMAGLICNISRLVDPLLKEIKIVFSKAMKESYSINLGEKGKEYYPVTGVIGDSAHKKIFSIETDLKSGQEYEFILTRRTFVSTEGTRLSTTLSNLKPNNTISRFLIVYLLLFNP